MNRWTILLISFLCPLLFCANNVFAQKVLVNIWDGTQWDNIETLYSNGQLPNAKSVGSIRHLTSNQECFDSNNNQCLAPVQALPGPDWPLPADCNCMVTVTKPQHATMLTGVLADVHHVFSNQLYALIPKELTVYYKLEELNTNIKTAHIISKPQNIGLFIFGDIVNVVDFFYAKAVEPVKAANQAIKLIDQGWWKDDFLIVVHFRNPDEVGHQYGVSSLQYRAALLENDYQLGRTTEVLSKYGILDETKVYVLGDHGFGCQKAKAHSCSPNTFVISNDAAMTDIHMVEFASYILHDFGVQQN